MFLALPIVLMLTLLFILSLFHFRWTHKNKMICICCCSISAWMPVKSGRKLRLAEQEVPLVTSWGRHRTDDRGESIHWVWGDALGHSNCWLLIPHWANLPCKIVYVWEICCFKYIFYALWVIQTPYRLYIYIIDIFPPIFQVHKNA